MYRYPVPESRRQPWGNIALPDTDRITSAPRASLNIELFPVESHSAIGRPATVGAEMPGDSAKRTKSAEELPV
jgi:hypothetical protein